MSDETASGVRLRDALEAELLAVTLREPSVEAVVAAGRRRHRVGRVVTSAAVAGALLVAGGTYWAVDTLAPRTAVVAQAGAVPPGAPRDLVGAGELNGHTWEVRVHDDPRTCGEMGPGFGCDPARDPAQVFPGIASQATVDGAPGGWGWGSPPQVLQGDPKEGIGHLNYGGGPISGGPFDSVLGVASAQVAWIDVDFADGPRITVTPTDVGLQYRWFVFVFTEGTTYQITAYDANGVALARGAVK